MRKEEILEKVRREGMDEREVVIDRESYLYGLMAVLALTVVFQLWKIFKGIPYADMASIMSIQFAAISFYKYRKYPEQKIFLLATIFLSILTLISIIIFFMWI